MNPAKRTPALAALLVVVATCAVYSNTLHAPFVFDDVSSIIDNPTIRRLWPPGEALSPPGGWGFTVSGRPVLNFSFAVNYAISGFNVWSYHALNIAIHALAGLALFGIARRTLARPPLRERFGENAPVLAAVIALAWVLHPLQTESVTYTVQRAESLMGLLFLATLYGFVRAVDSPTPRRWWIFSFVACLLGVGTKEIAALAPLLVLLYDRTFVAGSFRAAWQQRRWPHLALAATWIPLALLLAGTGGNRGGTSGFNIGVTPTDYWATQFEAVTRYVGLAFWPHPQVFDYGKIAAGSFGATALWAVPVLALGGATLVALWRWPVAGFFGAWFFVLLAPTSFVPGALQMVVEHRVYLPLAAIVAFALSALALRCTPRTLRGVGAILVLTEGTLTFRRNALYRDERTLWADTLVRRPNNARAHNNLGLVDYRAGRLDDAISHYQAAVRLDPGEAHMQFNFGLALMKAGHLAESVAPLSEAARILPYYFDAHLNLGIVLSKLGRAEEALPHFIEAIRFDPAPAEAHFRFGVALADLGRWSEAIEHYAETIRLDPRHAEAHSNWGVALVQTNATPAALEHFSAALRLNPDLPDVHFNFALALARLGRADEAIMHYTEAVRLAPAHFDAHLNLGIALAQTGKPAEGLAHLAQAAQLRPDSPEAHTNLALALLDAGRSADALAHYETALRLRPSDPRAHYNVGYALLDAGRTAEAPPYFERALQLEPNFAAARDMLRRLGATPP